MQTKSHYTAAELAAMQLQGMPITEQGVRLRAKTSDWASRLHSGRGGGLEYAVTSLPKASQEDLFRRSASVTAATTSNRVVDGCDVTAQWDLLVTDKQLLCSQARKGVLIALERIKGECGVSRNTAMAVLLERARNGLLDDSLTMMLRAARDPRGRNGDGFPSFTTLKRWLGKEKVGSLVPKTVQKDLSIKPWFAAWREIHNVPENPTVVQSYARFVAVYRDRTDIAWTIPSIHQVRRALEKMDPITREAGRKGPRELKSLCAFVRRTFDELQPNDIWTADGHTFDAEVQHPLHGRAFRPEVTSIVDIATRRGVGFSIALSESSLAVLDALSNAVTREGVLAMFYVDNGSGYRNAMLSAAGTGMAGTIGFEIQHSLPYNSQARGVIERFHKTLWVRAAKELPNYVGADMDREARQENFKITRAAIKQGGALPLVGWDQFLQYCNECVAQYNATPHSALPKIRDPQTGRMRHMSPDERLADFRAKGWEPNMLGVNEAKQLFRPRVERTVRRCEIQFLGNRYFDRSLEMFHGDMVHVAYDIHDSGVIWVYHLDGRFICTADAGANERPYFPVSVVERAREKRADAREQRLQLKLDEVQAERRGHPALPLHTPEFLDIPGLGRLSSEDLRSRVIDVESREPDDTACAANVVEIPETAEQRFARWQALDRQIANGDMPDEQQLKWHSLYQCSKEYAAQKRRAEDDGEWQLANQG